MKWHNVKKVMACLLAGALLTGAMSGCGSSDTTKEESKTTSSAQQSSASVKEESSAESQAEETGITYPIEGNVKLTIAMVAESAVTAYAEDLMATPFGQAWQEATGVEVEMITLADADAMSLLYAGGDLPDIIWTSFSSYTGGVDKAIKDGIIQPLNDYMEYAPDLQAVMDSNDMYKKSNTTDGYIVSFPFIRGDDYLLTSNGLMIRQDWLDELGLDVPQTADDLYEVLKAFKEEKGAEVPFSPTDYGLKSMCIDQGIITSAFGLVKGGWYQVDGTVHYGVTEPEYKDVLTYLHKLYEEGLLDPNFQTLDNATRNANIMNGASGVTVSAVGGGMGSYLTTMADDPTYDLTGFGPLVANAGDTPMSTQYTAAFNGNCCVITPNCENIEAAVQFLNYGYTEEGSMLFNYGIEGESYTIENGVATYTDLIMNNPEGLTKQQAMAQYLRAWNHGPFVQEKGYMEQYANMPQQVDALNQWTNSDASKYQMPPVSIAEADTAEYSKLMGDIDTYISEMYIKYITGIKSLDTFESEYLATLETLGIDRAIEIQQTALDNFNAR